MKNLKKKRNICVVVASRANYGRCKSILYAIKKNPLLNLQIILCASALIENYGNIENVIKKDGFKINEKINFVLHGNSPVEMSKTTGLGVILLSQAFYNLKPEVVVTIADRYETMATAIAASYQNIILAHVQGGEVTGSIDESVRHAITKLSHIHFPATQISKKRIIKMGEPKNLVFNVGCPSIDNLKQIHVNKSKLTYMINQGVGKNIDIYSKYVLVLFHPVTTSYYENIQNIEELTKAILLINQPIIWLWPNIDSGSDFISKKLRTLREKYKDLHIKFIKNLEVSSYNFLLSNCNCAIGNSSSFIREGSYLGVPSVIVGERQNNREIASNVVFVKNEANSIIQGYKKIIKKNIKKSYLYGKGDAGKKISKILSGKLPFVQKSLCY